MESFETVNAWLNAFSEQAGEALSLNREGACTFLYGDDVPAAIGISEDAYHLYAELVELPQQLDADLSLIEKAMQLNAFQYMTGGATLMLGVTGQTIAMGYSHPIAGGTPENFCNIMDGFLNKCADMKKELTGTEGKDDSDSPPPHALRV